MTTLANIASLLDAHQRWLRDKTVLRDVGDAWIEITTPYLDRHNDALQIYARVEDGKVTLTDDGYTIDDLEASGCNLESPKRKDLLDVTLNGFGVQMQGNALRVVASADNFPARKHNLLQAMLAVNDLFFLASPFVESFFIEDVTAWLDLSGIRYTTRAKFSGLSGFDHMFDFVIPKSPGKQPERFVQAINRPDRNHAEALIHAWTDTRPNRSSEAKAYAILNDTDEHKISTAVIEALQKYGITPVPYTKREQIRLPLAA